jgi:hypothetical protein
MLVKKCRNYIVMIVINLLIDCLLTEAVIVISRTQLVDRPIHFHVDRPTAQTRRHICACDISKFSALRPLLAFDIATLKIYELDRHFQGQMWNSKCGMSARCLIGAILKRYYSFIHLFIHSFRWRSLFLSEVSR